MVAYAELHAHSYFSLLDGASAPEALAAQAAALGLDALALTDHDSLAGALRFQSAARAAGLHALFGAELTLADGTHLTALAEDQTGYGNLCRLISASRLAQLPPPAATGGDEAAWPGKVEAALHWETLARHSAGLILLSGCRQGATAAALLQGDETAALAAAGRLRELAGPEHCFVELQHHLLPDDDRLVRGLIAVARRLGLPLVATNNVHYAAPSGSRLRDALTAVRHNSTLTAARRAGHLPANSTFHLLGAAAMARRFHQRSDALANTLAIARRCQVTLDFSARRLPAFVLDRPQGLPADVVAARSEFELLYRLCHTNLERRYPHLQPAVLTQLAHELAVIEQAGLAGYFLLVWDLVRFAREQGIRCQGRGSAANSIVAYLLEITSVDPLRHDLLFERFLSADKFTMPDIDIDFAADRREEVIQYVYRRYGREHAAMVCNVVTYRARSALRDLGKVLEIPEEAVQRLAAGLESQSPAAAADHVAGQLAARPAASDPGQPAAGALGHLADLLRAVEGCPRHLSIHSGGMLITGAPLERMVPLEPATMPGRVVCQWDKDSVEDAGLIKIDLLGLRMLGLISQALTLASATGVTPPELDALPLDDPAIYRMLQAGDTVGAFQVESRAQQQMLPRLKPTCFEDMVVEVAIVRPGPIQGGAVHPYLRRRDGVEPVTYLHPSLEPVLRETLGVLLFQEQAIRVAVAAAGFSPGEADLLRRAMSRSRAEEAMEALRRRFVSGAAAQGIAQETAHAVFDQLAGFAGYGFCKSHAASFALIAYQSLYLKRYAPAAFYCALFNQQPMGFYAPEVIAGDARRHGVEIRPPAINRSDWLYTVETDGETERTTDGAALRSSPDGTGRRPVLRMGLCTVAGLGRQAWEAIHCARQDAPFADLADLQARTRLPKDVLPALIRAGALDAFGARRALLWRLGELDQPPGGLPLTPPHQPAALPSLHPVEEAAWEYELLGLSAHHQVMVHYRAQLRQAGVLATWEVKQARPGARVRTAGLVVVRQRPATAKGILFMSLEDESGLLDLVVKPPVYARLRSVLRDAPLLLVEGLVQRAGRATSLLIHAATPLASFLPLSD